LNVVHETGLNFAPKCNNFCFTRKTVCDHIKNNVPINNLGDYVVFPSNCFHQGYYNSDSDMVYRKKFGTRSFELVIACRQ
jgi:hypothetical protein